MPGQYQIWELIYKSLEENTPVMLLYVMESSGSSPGRRGFFMAVNNNGEIEGSIGGGIMEHKFVELARQKLQTPADTLHNSPECMDTPLVRKQIHNKTAVNNQSGMICSGEQTILIYPLNQTDKIAVQRIIQSFQTFNNGTLELSPRGIAFEDRIPAMDFEFEFHSVDNWIYRERTGYRNYLFIIGGGHCSLALSRLMRSMDFFIKVFDDRKELKTMEQNNAAHEKHLINNYSELAKLIPGGPNQYVVIMTLGYRTDDLALRALLGKKLRYCGMLGSQAKIDNLLADYRHCGINQELLLRLHAPVGIPINSQTPEEIAVSIAAELIKVKNEHIKAGANIYDRKKGD